MNLLNFKNYYFIGIGGIGMSALARYIKIIKKNIVGGYDIISTNLTHKLEKEGIIITYKDVIEEIPKEFLIKEKTLIIYTPAIPKNNIQLNFFKKQKYIIKKRSELLAIITNNTYSIAIAGTHGKTTISCLLGHIFNVSKKKCTTFIGGISENYNSNLIYSGKEISVVEADEFDKSFLYLNPNKICITSIDPDHLDIYYTNKNLYKTYNIFSKNIKNKGTVLIKKGLSIKGDQNYSVKEKSDYYSDNIIRKNNFLFFDFHGPNIFWKKLFSPLIGIYNIENITAALAIASQMNITENQIRNSLNSFLGIKRRFSIHYKSINKIYIDDYAHHPTSLKFLIKSIREWYPGKKILGIFQPHLFSRTRDFLKDFIKSLELLDSLILLDIYPAREDPIPGITSKNFINLINLKEKELTTLFKVIPSIEKKKFDILISIGAGNIETVINPIKKWLKKNRY